MYHGKLVVQRIRKAPSAPLRATGIAPTLLHVCCICGHIREETGTSANREHWVTQWTYRQTHGVKLANYPLTHTYMSKVLHEAHGYTEAVRPGTRNAAMILLAGSLDVDSL